MLFWPPNFGRSKLLLAMTASIPLAFLAVRAAKVDKLSPNEGRVSFDGRHLFDDTLIEERMAEILYSSVLVRYDP